MFLLLTSVQWFLMLHLATHEDSFRHTSAPNIQPDGFEATFANHSSISNSYIIFTFRVYHKKVRHITHAKYLCMCALVIQAWQKGGFEEIIFQCLNNLLNGSFIHPWKCSSSRFPRLLKAISCINSNHLAAQPHSEPPQMTWGEWLITRFRS